MSTPTKHLALCLDGTQQMLSSAVFFYRVVYGSILYLSNLLCLYASLSLSREVKKRTDEDDSKSITNLSGTSSKKSTQMKNCCNG